MKAQSAQSKVTEAAFRVGETHGGNVLDQETVGGERGASRSMKTSQKKRLLGGI